MLDELLLLAIKSIATFVTVSLFVILIFKVIPAIFWLLTIEFR